MPASSLAPVILAGLIHAVWNIAAKKAGGDVRFATFTGLLMALIWAPLGIWLGVWLHRRASEAAFYRVSYTLLFVTGLKLIWERNK